MTHLTDDQLSAFLDGALAPAERAAYDEHLASCDVCPAKLAQLSSLDRALGTALTHDPGDAYFATFADRVTARIAAGEAQPSAGTAAPAVRRSPWAWLLSPRGLSFAGGMAALLLTAGIAWLRFQHVDAVSALRAAAPSGGGSRLKGSAAPKAAADEAVPEPAAPTLAPTRALTRPSEERAAPVPAPAPSPSRDDRSLEARADAGSQRAREVKKLANGESVPVTRSAPKPDASAPVTQARLQSSAGQEAAGAPSAASKPTPAPAEMKRQAMAKQFFTAPPPAALSAMPPAPQGVAEKDALAPGASAGLATDSQRTRNEVHFRGGRSSEELKLELADASPLAVQCGTVSETRGTPVAGVQITLLGASTRSSRSAADGSFCLPRAVVGDTLILMHVGFEPVRVVLTASTSLAFGLEPVGTLGSHAGLSTGAKSEGLLRIPPAATGQLEPSAFKAPAPDVYARESDSVRNAVAKARERTTIARRDRSGDAWEAAASSWDGIAAMVSGHAGYDARFQSVSALREAWRAAPTPARAERLRARMAAFIAATPRTLPERATVLRWRGELAGPAFR